MSRAGGTGNVYGASSLTGGSSVDRHTGTALTERQWRAARRIQAVLHQTPARTGRRHHGDADSMRRNIRHDGAGRRGSKHFQSFSQVD